MEAIVHCEAHEDDQREHFDSANGPVHDLKFRRLGKTVSDALMQLLAQMI